MNKPKYPSAKQRKRIHDEAHAFVLHCSDPISAMDSEERKQRLRQLLLYPSRTRAFIQMTQILAFTEYSAACNCLGPIEALRTVDPWKEVAMYVAIQHVMSKKRWKEKV